jgi:predicted metal-dependent enzyme (double-stranded beta helix superfamily)
MMRQQTGEPRMSAERQDACSRLIQQARAIVDAEGTGQASLDRIKTLLVDLANTGESLFPPTDFAMPDAQGRNHILALEGPTLDGEDGMGLYLTIALPGKEAAPHDHGIWCVNAAISGREVHRFYRHTDDGSRDGYAAVEPIGEVTVAPGQGMAMTDHAIHATEVLGTELAIGLALYGYALARFPSVVWFHPDFCSVRTRASRRLEAA